MNLVPAIGKLDAELGRDHSAAAVGGIARDSYFHLLEQDTGIGCMCLIFAAGNLVRNWI